MSAKVNMDKYYPTSQYTTYLKTFKLFGLSPIKKRDWIYTFFPIFFLLTGIVHYWPYVYFKNVNGYEKVDVMEASHWGIFCTGLTVIAVQQIRLRNVYVAIDKMVKSGVFDYGEDFTDEQLKTRQEGNEYVRKLSKPLWICLLLGINAALTKHTIFSRKPGVYNTIFIGWFPFEINSLSRYSMTLIYHTIMAYNAGTAAYLGVMGFYAVSSQFCTQLKIFDLAIKDAINEKSEAASIRKLKKCVQHYNQIKKLYFLMETYFGSALGAIPIIMVFLICTFLYDLTDPDVKIGGNVFVYFCPEGTMILIASIFGQTITDLSEEIANQVYFLDWYTKSIRVQKYVLMIMIGMHKPLAIKGFGVFPFNMEGLNEVLKGGYSYFNALNAARDKK